MSADKEGRNSHASMQELEKSTVRATAEIDIEDLTSSKTLVIEDLSA